MKILYGSKPMKRSRIHPNKENDKMSFNRMECPMCFRSFSSDFIEIHAQKCTGENLIKSSKNDSIMEKHEAKKMKFSSSGFSPFSQKTASSSKDVWSLEPGRGDSNNTNHPETRSIAGSRMRNDYGTGRVPLADRSRPCSFDDYVGQEKILGKEGMLNNLLKGGMIPSMILWGPPGCGKTSLAHVISMEFRTHPEQSNRFVKLSATNSGKADIQKAIEAAKNEHRMFKRKTVLFIDEIHRFNKLQQDTFLPHIENGTIILVGATTENPSFSLNSALLSRCRVVVLDKLSQDEVKQILIRSLKKFEASIEIKWNDVNAYSDASNTETSSLCQSSTVSAICISEDAIEFLACMCDGDARTALNGLQMAIQIANSRNSTSDDAHTIGVESVKKSLHRSHVLYDRAGDQHYEMISAFQKSIRGSDDNATLYWLTRMLEGGEDPKYIARRMIRIASEDVGLADSSALTLAVSTQQACQFVGLPECNVVLAHCAVYLARAPKSAEVYMALRKAMDNIRNHKGPLPGVPLHLRNASTKLMKDLGYGVGYQYKTTSEETQTYMPDSLSDCNFFHFSE